jgi:hypothetical protein
LCRAGASVQEQRCMCRAKLVLQRYIRDTTEGVQVKV